MDFVTLDRVSLRYGEEGTLALAETTLAVAEANSLPWWVRRDAASPRS
jgi:hypothetical protein